jgi:SAM-dependent MidA family methyltransferase
LEKVIGDFSEMDTREQLELSRQVKILILPGEMGERFKVMVLSRKLDLPFKGFELVDHRGHL